MWLKGDCYASFIETLLLATVLLEIAAGWFHISSLMLAGISTQYFRRAYPEKKQKRSITLTLTLELRFGQSFNSIPRNKLSICKQPISDLELGLRRTFPLQNGVALFLLIETLMR